MSEKVKKILIGAAYAAFTGVTAYLLTHKEALADLGGIGVAIATALPVLVNVVRKFWPEPKED